LADATECGHVTTPFRLQDPTGKAGRSVRRQLGHSLLSSLTHTYTLENRDSRLRPTEGWGVRVTSQLAGLGLDANMVRFVKEVRED
jgi:outer membrane protein insertion porin family